MGRIDKSKGKVQPSRPGRKRERSVSRLRGEFEELGVDMSGTKDANFARNPSKSRSRPPLKKRRADSEGTVRSSSKAPRDKSGMRDPEVCFFLFLSNRFFFKLIAYSHLCLMSI